MISAIILAAGSGTRMQLDKNKVFIKINDEEIIKTSVKKFSSIADEIIVVYKNGELEMLESILKNYKIKYVNGGDTRQESVWEGLKVVTKKYVFVHDGARPYISKEVLNEMKDKMLKKDEAYICGTPSIDTCVLVENGKIIQSIDRNKLYNLQTPQAAPTNWLIDVHEKAQKDNFIGTDESSLLLKYGYHPIIVNAGYDNIKITTPNDLK